MTNSPLSILFSIDCAHQQSIVNGKHLVLRLLSELFCHGLLPLFPREDVCGRGPIFVNPISNNWTPETCLSLETCMLAFWAIISSFRKFPRTVVSRRPPTTLNPFGHCINVCINHRLDSSVLALSEVTRSAASSAYTGHLLS